MVFILTSRSTDEAPHSRQKRANAENERRKDRIEFRNQLRFMNMFSNFFRNQQNRQAAERYHRYHSTYNPYYNSDTRSFEPAGARSSNPNVNAPVRSTANRNTQNYNDPYYSSYDPYYNTYDPYYNRRGYW